MAVVDVQLADGARGLDLVPELRARRIYTFGLSGHGSAALALQALSAGCRWFYEKTNDQLRLLQSAVANALRGDLDEEPPDIPSFWPLTPRQVEVTSMEYRGFRTENIAARLEIEEATVRRHRGDVLSQTRIPYWELALAFLRAWQTPRPPHFGDSNESKGAKQSEDPRDAEAAEGTKASKDSKASEGARGSKRLTRSKKSKTSKEGE